MSSVMVVGDLPGIASQLEEAGLEVVAEREPDLDRPSAATVRYLIVDDRQLHAGTGQLTFADVEPLLSAAGYRGIRVAVVFHRMTSAILEDVVLRAPGVDLALMDDRLSPRDLADLQRLVAPQPLPPGAVAIGSLLPMSADQEGYERDRSLSLVSDSMRQFISALRGALVTMDRPRPDHLPWYPSDRGTSLVRGRDRDEPTLADKGVPLLRDLFRAPQHTRARELFTRPGDPSAWARPPEKLLIQGESGTGKSLVARLVHDVLTRPRSSPGRSPVDSELQPPLVRISCGGIDTRNFEHVMFGSAPGYFTDVSAAPGLLARAAYGTAFFDEIGDLPLEAQARLLTFLDDHVVTPVGMDPFYGFVHVVGATNRNLEYRRDLRHFRHDLLARFQFRVRLPPLRERGRAELRQLIDFVAQNPGVNPPRPQDGGERAVSHIDAGAYERLLGHDYRTGNFRELETVIATALRRAIEQGSRILRSEDLDGLLATPDQAIADEDEHVVAVRALPTSETWIAEMNSAADLRRLAALRNLPILADAEKGLWVVVDGGVRYVAKYSSKG